VFVHQDYREILKQLVLRRVVVKIPTALPMRSVTMSLAVNTLERNVNHFVIQAIVLLEQIVPQEITGRPVLADLL
jgi:hypothetical protein